MWAEHFAQFSPSLSFFPPRSCQDIDTLTSSLHKCFLDTFLSIQNFILNRNKSKRNSSLSSSLYYKKSEWWNAELQSAHNHLSIFSSSDPTYSSHRIAYKHLVIKTKKDHFKKIIEKCTEDDIWSLHSWCTKPRKNNFLSSINFSSGPAFLSHEIAQGFIHEFFSPSEISPIYSSLLLDSLPLNPRDFAPITLNEVENALKTTSNSSSPGIS